MLSYFVAAVWHRASRRRRRRRVSQLRVNVWDPAKWVARVRAANTGDAPVLLRVSDTDGHLGPGNTVDGLKNSALEMAFLEKRLEVGKGL